MSFDSSIPAVWQSEMQVSFTHRVFFTHHIFSEANPLLANLLEECRKVLIFLDAGLLRAFPSLLNEIQTYWRKEGSEKCVGIEVLQGGEKLKEGLKPLLPLWEKVKESGLDRHCCVIGIGGGALLDAVGFVASTAHRGIRHLRIPTTSLSQDDSGVGVKNGINLWKTKHFLGAFSVPYAVINDFAFLQGLAPGLCREGLIEAVKVALVKDRHFFAWIEENAEEIVRLEQDFLEKIIAQSAILHAKHIIQGGDPFEWGSSRPLDYGHWVAHRLEEMSGFELRHGAAVAIGIALDTLYAQKAGFLEEAACQRVFSLLQKLGFSLWHPLLEKSNERGTYVVLDGLEAFRQHLGGELTILLLKDIGKGFDVHSMDRSLLTACIQELKTC